MSQWSVAVAAVLGMIVLVLLGVLLLYRWLNAKELQEKAIKQALWLGAFVLIAVVADERVVRLLPLPSFCSAIYTMNYAVKWEIMALFATAMISKFYIDSELEGQGKVRPKYLAKAVKLLNWAWPMLLAAGGLLVGMLWAPNSIWREALFGIHFFFAWAVTILFLKADKAIWEGVIPDKDPKNNLKDITRLTYLLADWPVCLSLTLLGGFVALHWSEHTLFHRLEYGSMPMLRSLLHHSPKEIDPVNMWVSEEYFMSGAIAFQFFITTTLYVILALGLAGIHGPERKLELE